MASLNCWRKREDYWYSAVRWELCPFDKNSELHKINDHQVYYWQNCRQPTSTAISIDSSLWRRLKRLALDMSSVVTLYVIDYDSMVSGPIDHSEGWQWRGNIDVYVGHVSFNVGNIGTGNVYSFMMSRFQLFRADSRTRIYRRVGEITAPCCVQETVPFGGGSVMVWGGICGQ